MNKKTLIQETLNSATLDFTEKPKAFPEILGKRRRRFPQYFNAKCDGKVQSFGICSANSKDARKNAKHFSVASTFPSILGIFRENSVISQSKNFLLRSLLIGLEVEITEARCKGYIGLKGRIVDETKNTFLLENDRIRRVPKKDVKFRFITSDGRRIEVSGSMLMHRPEDRIKKIG